MSISTDLLIERVNSVNCWMFLFLLYLTGIILPKTGLNDFSTHSDLTRLYRGIGHGFVTDHLMM